MQLGQSHKGINIKKLKTYLEFIEHAELYIRYNSTDKKNLNGFKGSLCNSSIFREYICRIGGKC